MKKAFEVAKEIAKEFSTDSEKVFLESVGKEEADAFIIKRYRNSLRIEASNERSAAYAISQARQLSTSSHFHQLIGENRPLFPLRPLWMVADEPVAFSSSVGGYLPKCFLNNDKGAFEKLCKRILEYGYNAILLGNKEGMFGKRAKQTFKELALLQELFSDFGIQLILKPVLYTTEEETIYHTPTHSSFQESIERAFADLFAICPSLEAVFWESAYLDEDFHYHPSAREYTKFDKVGLEVSQLSSLLPLSKKLIYYLPSNSERMAEQQSRWWLSLLNQVDSRTICAFSALSGSPFWDYLQPHPFWEVMQTTIAPPATPLMPILNIGGIELGEGYWPNMTLDLLETPFSDCPLAGLVSCIKDFPEEGEILEGMLYATGMSQWRKKEPKALLQEWYQMRFKEGNYSQFFSIMQKVRSIIKELKFFYQEKTDANEARFKLETMIALLNEVEHATRKIEFSRWNKSIEHFLVDARRLIQHFGQVYDLSFSELGASIKGVGILTKVSTSVSVGMSRVGHVRWLDRPLTT